MNADTQNLIDLKITRATEGLSTAQERELEQLLATAPGDHPEFELAAAAAANAIALQQQGSDPASAPSGLKARLAADAERFFTEGESPATVISIANARSKSSVRENVASPGFFSAGRMGWATAAILVLALVLTNRPDAPTPEPLFDPVVARARLMLEAADTVVVPWATPEVQEYANVSGDVVWSDARQEGYMRLAGMPANDPEQTQYQLWIVDPERDTHPVDGGVFDVPPGGGDVVIPISSKLMVSGPAAFAITREKPGGVVVSAGPLLVVASVDSAA